MSVPEVIYILCALLSIFVLLVLFRGYRKTRNMLLLWSALSFGFMAMNNIVLCVDFLIFPTLDINGPLWRNILSACSGLLLLFGLVQEVS